MGRPEAPQRSALLQRLGFMGDQMLKHLQLPGAVVGQLRIEVLDVGRGRNGAAHRNTPRRPGASAGWLPTTAVCMPEGKNSALTVIQRSRQAFTWRGAWIQLGISHAPTNAAEKTIWPVSKPWEAAATSSRRRRFMKPWRNRILLPGITFLQIKSRIGIL